MSSKIETRAWRLTQTWPGAQLQSQDTDLSSVSGEEDSYTASDSDLSSSSFRSHSWQKAQIDPQMPSWCRPAVLLGQAREVKAEQCGHYVVHSVVSPTARNSGWLFADALQLRRKLTLSAHL